MKRPRWFHRLLAAALLVAASACPSTSPAPETAEELRDKLLTNPLGPTC